MYLYFRIDAYRENDMIQRAEMELSTHDLPNKRPVFDLDLKLKQRVLQYPCDLRSPSAGTQRSSVPRD